MQNRNALLLSLGFALALTAAPRAEEHPHEHPQEHPAAPAAQAEAAKPAAQKPRPAEAAPVTGSKQWNREMRREFNEAVRKHVLGQAAGGAFKVQDDKLGKEWELKLIRVHKHKIVHLGAESFFACADFKTVGKGRKENLDLDFYATKGPDGWKIDKTLVHKVGGKPRYTYNQKNEMIPAGD